MKNPPFPLLALAIAASLAGPALAQGDNCSGALPVTFGTSGPYTNVGATASLPAWPCGAGGTSGPGADVWFSYTAPGNGTLTVDTCGGSFDGLLEIFNGSGGCGGLVSLGCDDDFCGGASMSSLTVPVTNGTLYYIRVGGWNSLTGTFPLNVNGPTGGGTVATATNYGIGCVGRFMSIYELFPMVPSIDLSNRAIRMLNTGSAYVVLPSTAAFVAPSGTATNLMLSDDSETLRSLSTPLPYPGGSTPSLNICSNGHIATASNGNAMDYTPTPAEFLGWNNTAWAVWRDFYPTTTGPDNVWFEEVAGVAYITWLNVLAYVGTTQGTTPSTFQFQFDLTTGDVTLVFLSLDTVSVSAYGQAWLVGYSPGGPSLDPGSVDLTTALPIALDTIDLGPPLVLAAQRPIANTTINLTTSNIPAGSPFGAILLGLANPNASLAGIGMPGCTRYTDGLVTLLFIAPGTTVVTTLAVPNAVGVTLTAQSAVYCPAAGFTPLGAIASQGVSLFIGNL